MIEEIAKGLHLAEPFRGTVVCRAFEDNKGALLLANKQCFSNRTRHFNVKHHWFWEQVAAEELIVLGCDTTAQAADGLPALVSLRFTHASISAPGLPIGTTCHTRCTFP